MAWMRIGRLPPYQTAVAMIGAKPGDRVAVLGSSDPALAAQVSLVTGLNGHVVVIDRAPGAADRVESAAARAGALVAFEEAPVTNVPLEASGFDIVVIDRLLGTLEGGER